MAIVGIIQLINLILLLLAIGIVIFGVIVLIKLNKALNIWIKQNEEGHK